MATNAIGLNLLLQANNNQVQDLLKGLQAGDTLRARIVDLLPQDKAVIQVQGQNLLAQLPVPKGGQSFVKGDVLQLEVVPSQTAPTNGTQQVPTPTSPAAPTPGAPANAAPSLTLRIIQSDPIAGQTQSGLSASGTNTLGNLPGKPTAPLPPVVVLEQSLVAAKLPINSANLAVAATLASHGLPLDAATIQGVVRQAESLLASEGGRPAPTGGNVRPELPPSVRIQLEEALPVLRLAQQSAPAATGRVFGQQALQLIQDALQGNPLAPTPAPVVPKGTVVEAPLRPQAAPESPKVGLSVRLEAAVQAVLKQPSAENVQNLRSLLGEALQPARPEHPPAVLTTPTPPAPNAAALAPALSPTTSIVPSGTSTPTPAFASGPALPAQREIVATLLSALAPSSVSVGAPSAPPVRAEAVVATATNLLQQLENPESPAARTLVQAVRSQWPEAPATQSLESAKAALQRIITHFEALPPASSFSGTQSIKAEIGAAQVPVPNQSLAQFPREVVFQAVAWLQARGLPPQRPLVEAAAQFLSKGQAALELAQQSVRELETLPTAFTREFPALDQAVRNLRSAIDASTLRPEGPDLAAQLRDWPKTSGLTLELEFLAQDSEVVAKAGGPAKANTNVPTLRQALAEVQEQLKQVGPRPEAQPPQVAQTLERAGHDSQVALQSLSALPLQAQPVPNIQSLTLPLALPLNGPIDNGQVTVSWRRDQQKTLNDKDPVNVAVALNTESLGQVKVLMQVWKGSANVLVKAEDEATAAFLKGGAEDLKAGFAERTPFRLGQLGFDVSAPGSDDPSPELSVPTVAGLNLSA